MKYAPILCLSILLQVGCGGAPGGGSEVSENTNSLVSRTIVQFMPDGTRHVKVDQITREEQKEEIAARRTFLGRQSSSSEIGEVQEATSQDTSCAGSSMWMFDDYTLNGREICFYGIGDADLTQYVRYYSCNPICAPVSWSHSVKSFWAGSEDGYFRESVDNCNSPFSADEREDTAPTCAQDAEYLYLTD